MASEGVRVAEDQSTTTEQTEDVDARTCPECGGQTQLDGDETVCEDCGLVVDEDRVDHGPEWRAFNLDEWDDRARTSAAIDPSLHDYGRGTTMGPDPDGVSPERARQLRRMRTWQSRAKFEGKSKQNMAESMGEVKRIFGALGVGQGRRDQACRLVRSAFDENLILGRSIEAIATASCYAVARIHGAPITLDDVVTVARVDRDAITTAYDALNRELGLPAPPPDPEMYVPRLASEMGLSDDQQRTATELAALSTAATSGCNPVGIAGAAVYLAAASEVTQKEVAEAAGVTTVTIRNRLADLRGGDSGGD